MDNAHAVGARMADALRGLVDEGVVTEVRGRGLMIGVETAGPIARAAMARARDEHRLLVNATGDTTLRIVPPLTISADEGDEAVTRLTKALRDASR
jgi:acetylornithine/succinyldiaminopimelate/putrescine aminotransferase